MDFINDAEYLIDEGFNPLPIRNDKRPKLPVGHRFLYEPITGIENLFKDCDLIAIACGKVSNGFYAIDFDAHDGEPIEDIYEDFLSYPFVDEMLNNGFISCYKTRGGGYHIYVKVDEVIKGGKFATWEDNSTMIELRGDGQYVIVNPSKGYEHVGGVEYIKLKEISISEYTDLKTLAKSFSMEEIVENDGRRKWAENWDNSTLTGQFNNESGDYAKELLLKNGWTQGKKRRDGVEYWTRPGKDPKDGMSATFGKFFNMFYVYSSSCDSFSENTAYNPFQIYTALEHNGDWKAAKDSLAPEETKKQKKKRKSELDRYLRVGADYFKIVKSVDRYGIVRTELMKWKKQEIIFDLGFKTVKKIKKYDKFIIVPDNLNYKQVIDKCFNMYAEFSHKPEQGDWKWTKILLEHIFGEQYNIGLIYMQCLFLYPKQALPVLALVSEERQTGKSTFLDLLTAIFGANMVIIDPNNIKSDFNGNFATANIIGIEETGVQDKNTTVEKIKSISTQKMITVNIKGVQHFSLPFFGKVIMNSNDEDKFIKIAEKEIRFLVRKIGMPKHTNHNILNDMIGEIPAFLHHLTTLPVPDFKKSRMVFTEDELKNESLARVKEESKSWLYKELCIIFEELYNDHIDGVGDLEFTAKDLYLEYFDKNNQVTKGYLIKTLKNELDMFPTEYSTKYTRVIGIDNRNINKSGKVYTLSRERFGVDITPIKVPF